MTEKQGASMNFLRNSLPEYGERLSELHASIARGGAAGQAQRFFARISEYRRTPLANLPTLAAKLGVGTLVVKDESQRLGLGNFKALGGAFAVARVAAQLLDRVEIDEEALTAVLSPPGRDILRAHTVACATDGNHGWSVAWGASILGLGCTIFLPKHVTSERERAIASLGAQVVRVDGVYDDACFEAVRSCRANGWHLVADFTTKSYDEVTAWVMQGYMVMLEEAFAQAKAVGADPTHVFVQAGCGGLAAAVAAFMRVVELSDGIIVTVEPSRARCLIASAERSSPARIVAGEPTSMGMLECYEPSHMAWPIIARTAALFTEIDEDEAARGVLALEQPLQGDPALGTSPSGAAGFAGLLACTASSEARAAIGLDTSSRVLVFATEGIAG